MNVQVRLETEEAKKKRLAEEEAEKAKKEAEKAKKEAEEKAKKDAEEKAKREAEEKVKREEEERKRKEEEEKEKAVRKVCVPASSFTLESLLTPMQSTGRFITVPSTQHRSCPSIPCPCRYKLHQLQSPE